MKPTLALLFTAVIMALAAATVQAAESPGAGNGANSVAGMLQKKHDTEVRAFLVSGNRWEEVRQMDAVTAQRQGAQHEAAYDRINKQLAHGTGGTGADGSPIDVRALECAADVTRVR